MADLTNEERIAQQLQPVVVGNTGPAILGIKFNDRDGDGIRDSGEEGLANVPIVLTSAGSAPVSTTTDANGAFSFINLVPGNYVVTETSTSRLQSYYSQSPRCHSWKHKGQRFIWQHINSRQPDRRMQIPRHRCRRLPRWE